MSVNRRSNSPLLDVASPTFMPSGSAASFQTAGSLVAQPSMSSVSQAGGFHLVPFLSQHGDALVAASQLTKYRTAAGNKTSAPTAAAAGKKLADEFALCTHAVVKLRIAGPPSPSGAADAGGPSPWSLLWREPHCHVRRVRAIDIEPSKLGTGQDRVDWNPTTNSSNLSLTAQKVLLVEFFSDKPRRKDVMHPCLKELLSADSVTLDDMSPQLAGLPKAAGYEPVVRSAADASAKLIAAQPELRCRALIFQSSFNRDEWLVLFKSAIMNYWHERLEKTRIPEPEIYQFHAWCVCTGGSGPKPTGAAAPAALTPPPTWCQATLSTIKLYLIARPTTASLSQDDTSDAAAPAANAQSQPAVLPSTSMYVAALGRVVVHASLPRVAIWNRAGDTWRELVFVQRSESTQFVIELQRVWEMVVGGGGGSGGGGAAVSSGGTSSSFPVEVSDC